MSAELIPATGNQSMTPANLNEALLSMMEYEMSRANKFQNMIDQLEDHMFTPEFLEALKSDAEQLLKTYAMFLHNKENAQKFVVRVLDVVAKNAILAKALQDKLVRNERFKKVSDDETIDNPKVRDLTKLIRRVGLKKIHGQS